MNLRFYIVLWLAILLADSIVAKPVAINEAEVFANHFVKTIDGAPQNCTVDTVYPYNGEQSANIYKVKFNPYGWMLLAADDVIQPVLGFSFDSLSTIEPSEPKPFRFWMQQYAHQINYAKMQDGRVKNRDWITITSNKTFVTQKSVSPLIQVNWDQDAGWNRYCPEDEDGPGGNAYVGCVAVAMAQAMSYFEYPEHAQGTHAFASQNYGSIFVNYNEDGDYDWESMEKSRSDEFNSKLLYHAAVAVDMNFGPDGSGTQTRRAKDGLIRNFGYPKGVMAYVDREEDDELWKEMLREVLDKGNLIIYSGRPDEGEEGHAFNIDGYLGDYFHFNWGWNGSYNGYFTINNLNPGNNVFTADQAAILNIRPPKPGPKDISLSKTEVRENEPAGTIVGVISVEDEVTDNSYSFFLNSGSMLKSTGDTLFYLERDTLKTAYKLHLPEHKDLNVQIYVEDIFNNTLEKTFNIEVISSDTPNAIKQDRELSNMVLYPNPSGGISYIKFSGLKQSELPIPVRVYTLSGQLIEEYSAGIKNQSLIELNLNNLGSGIYIIRVYTNYGIWSEKLIIN